MRLTSHQVALQMRNSIWPRKTKKWCGRCGGEHAGICTLVSTSHGTRTRPALLEIVEQRFRDGLRTNA